jgi:hypothetical protein
VLKQWSAIVTAGVLAGVMVECSAGPSPFDRQRKPSDRLPPETLSLVEGADPSTSRYEGTADGHNLYLVQGLGEIRFCLVYTDGTYANAGASCSGGDWLETKLPDGSAFRIQVNGFTDRPGAGEADVSRWIRQIAAARSVTS